MPSLLCTLMAPIAVFAVGMGPQVDRPDAEVPTAIERALMERACVATETVSAESYRAPALPRREAPVAEK